MNEISALDAPSDDFLSPQRRSVGKRAVSSPSWILAAFHTSCDVKDFRVAESLIAIFEKAALGDTSQPDGRRRQAIDLIVAAHERLWNLKHASDADSA